jgi:hypothetical protein
MVRFRLDVLRPQSDLDAGFDTHVMEATMGMQLGRLERQELRTVWAHEASGFTPWLAQAENLGILGETLGLSLELEAQEQAVGPFRADILCRDLGSEEAEHWVLIENQLERTDHSHLGQLLTYASGLEAVTIIWVASRFTEEHRSTLDWLNRITDDHFRFFGVEVELWRIGNSQAAPKFNVVAKPNHWSHAVKDAARAIDRAELSDIRLLQHDYWAALNEVLDKVGGPVAGNRMPRPKARARFPIGRQHFRLTATMFRQSHQICAELHIAGEEAKHVFRLLKDDQQSIEQELGYPLQWEELPDQQDCRIAVYQDDVDPQNQQDWPRQHDWLAEHLNDLHRVFAQRVRALEVA